MSLPDIAGHELHEWIGSGGCGAVYKARTADGRACVVKVFSSMAINRKALAMTSQALAEMPPHPAVVVPMAFGFDRSPYFWALPLYGVPGADSHGRPRWEVPTLEDLCQQGVDKDQAWALIYQLAEGLAWLHKHGIAHGNLRPCNVLILIEEGGEPRVRLTDMAQGWVGGIHHLDLGDHFVYLCPDQAENPEGVFEGEGPSWDVYSFGVIAYRLLTGVLPRGEEAWNQQLEGARQQVMAGLAYQIDSVVLLKAVRGHGPVVWPGEAATEWEERRRQIVERALDLNGQARWRDMREVLREFEILETDYLLEESRAQTVAERVKQAGTVRTLNRIAVALTVVLTLATVYAVVTWWRAVKAERLIAASEAVHTVDVAQREARAAAELAARDQRITALTQERDKAKGAKALADANLQHSQAAADQFLTQLLQTPASNAMEVEFSRTQMEEALAFCMKGLPGLEAQPELVAERARAYGNLGQIHLKLQHDDEAAVYLEKARVELGKLAGGGSGAGLTASYRHWQGRYCLLLGELKQRKGDDAAAYELLREATVHLQEGLAGDPQNRLARTESARAWLELGSRSFDRGDLAAARQALTRVAEVLDPKVIGSEWVPEEAFLHARSQFHLGLVSREEGQYEPALTAMIDAVRLMGEMVMGSSPRNQDQALALAEAYTILAELVGQHFSGKDAMDAHQQAVPILLELNRLLPEWAEVKYLLARNNGAIAQLDRDLGQTSEAMRKKQDAMELINEVLADYPANARYVFLQAKLRADYAGFLADAGKATESIAMVKLALTPLETLLAKAGGEGVDAKLMPPERKQWEIQLAQGYGVLGHGSQLAGLKAEAKAAFAKAAEHWQRLVAAGQTDDVIKLGLAWAQDRLGKLK